MVLLLEIQQAASMVAIINMRMATAVSFDSHLTLHERQLMQAQMICMQCLVVCVMHVLLRAKCLSMGDHAVWTLDSLERYGKELKRIAVFVQVQWCTMSFCTNLRRALLVLW